MKNLISFRIGRRHWRVLLLPGLTLALLGAWQGPELWQRLYPPVKEYCLMYLAGRSAWTIALPVIVSLSLVFMSVGLARLCLQLRTASRLQRRISDNTVEPPVRLSQAVTRCKVRAPVICVSDPSPLAFSYGFRNPQICVSSSLVDLLTDRELDAVLIHEDVHAVNRHPLRLLLAKVLSGVLFALPVTKRWEEYFELSIELKADQRAVEEVSAPHLAAALVKMLKSPSAPMPFQVGTALSATEERISRLTDDEGTYQPGLSKRYLLTQAGLSLGLGILAVGVISATGHFLTSGPLCPPPMA